jgi:hypothetical protein
VGKERLAQVESLSGMEIYTMLAVPMEVVGLVAWKIDKALLIDLRLEILLVSLVCFNISEGFKVMMIILISKAKMAMTINSSIRVKDLDEPACRQAGVKERLDRRSPTKEDVGGVKLRLFSFNFRNEGMGWFND